MIKATKTRTLEPIEVTKARLKNLTAKAAYLAHCEEVERLEKLLESKRGVATELLAVWHSAEAELEELKKGDRT